MSEHSGFSRLMLTTQVPSVLMLTNQNRNAKGIPISMVRDEGLAGRFAPFLLASLCSASDHSLFESSLNSLFYARALSG